MEQARSDDVSSPVLGGPGENVGPALLYPWLWNSDLGRRGGEHPSIVHWVLWQGLGYQDN